tara:strand:- start:1978 stop:2166 length:189 start_codon:yes stop_codon:yes gene_type:complete
MSQKKPGNMSDQMSPGKHYKSGKTTNSKHFTGKKSFDKKKKRPSSTTRKQRKAKKGSHQSKY